MFSIEPHPDLDARVFVTKFPQPLGQLGAVDSVLRWLVIDADAPISPPEDTKSVVRDLLRHGGYKPTGRGKPASEYPGASRYREPAFDNQPGRRRLQCGFTAQRIADQRSRL